MTPNVATALVVLKTLALLLGGSITYHAFKAYRRTRSPALRALAIGFGVVTLGAIFGGVVDQLLPLDPNLALVVESLFTTVGFGIILYSLYVD
ncbi:hypothetical protein C499_06790 [Halogeometricum borinquense DSM 11551]|uniref:YapH protein n=2 Tax=Halogeometricum borinquense TaxID=60847 RepID=E4NUW3_HALBP|nr:hypothetical protein [Halogeometricum borinquense]ADQ68952.1 hypothetical protein Hbor_34310 [Halogeometricum borinquense DSM 11551]ELY29124.1 hypothetical protein C499_06790 [Halogeometricum borinquense DSM 11551]RYJ08143.1 hypothetical protein ELS19_16335 [Halogeometricum borinquense]